ncbi:MAG TPA: hypothetical protein ENJ82_10580 [Bacteroidetes bacterium]|nr:hypothetical protein [Bacteroidota bacterium]
MKKVLLPLIIAVSLSFGVYFMFFYNNSKAIEKVTLNQPGTPAPFTADDTIPFGDPPDGDALEREQLLMEHARPEKFITVEFEDRRNILRETILEGTLRNEATLTTYNNFQMMIYFEDAEGSVLDSASQLIFETIMPKKEVTFRIKQKGPRKAKTVQLHLQNAQVVEAE